MEATIELHGGFCNGVHAPDMGTDTIRLLISKEDGDVLIPGFAIYEVCSSRNKAFFLENEWAEDEDDDTVKDKTL